MDEIELKSQSPDGTPLRACFLPGKGMNLISYKKGNIEIIDQSTKPLFEERFAGLGAMIGPHFHHRNSKVIPPIKDESKFPHIAKVKAQGSSEPFSHGIGRYAPWTVETSTESSIQAALSGSNLWNGVALKELEGQDFKMSYNVHLHPDGLEILLSVKSDTESVVGLHTYYALADGKGTITSRVQGHYVDQTEFKPIPSTWNYGFDHMLVYPLDQDTDFGFHPFPDPLRGNILLDTSTHRVKVQYECSNQENSFQLWHPKGASFVCIEPLSAKVPRKPKLTVSQIKILISIV